MPDLDGPADLQRRPAAGAGVAGADRRHLDVAVDGAVATGHDVACVPDAPHTANRAGLEGEGRVFCGFRQTFSLLWRLRADRQHFLFERDLKVESVDHFAVVAERLGPRRLLVGRHERQTADLQQLGRREEHHLRREVVNRIDERALLDDLIVEAALPGRNGRRQAARARADDHQIARQHN